jgi:hypothetical protein
MQINCPECKHQFLLDDVLSADKIKEIKKELKLQNEAKLELEKKNWADQLEKEKTILRDQMQAFVKQKDSSIEESKAAMALELAQKEKQLKDRLFAENASKLKFLEEENNAKDLQIKNAQANELEILKLKNEIKNQSQQNALDLEKAMLIKEQELKESIYKNAVEQAEEKFLLQNKELHQKLDQQKKLIDDQQRKMAQGSMEQQGEAQENLIKERLQKMFVYDEIIDVKKGAKGADLVQNIRNSRGETCGTIIYESKNTKSWSNDWLDKMIEDMRAQGSDIGVIVSQVLPANIKSIGQEKGVWICSFKEFEGVAAMLRDGIIKIYESKKSQENKGDKMVQLYNFLNSNEFKQQWEGILQGYKKMKDTIDSQRNYLIRTFAEQDKIIENILLNGNTFMGNIKGIAGSGLDEMKYLE